MSSTLRPPADTLTNRPGPISEPLTDEALAVKCLETSRRLLIRAADHLDRAGEMKAHRINCATVISVDDTLDAVAGIESGQVGS